MYVDDWITVAEPAACLADRPLLLAAVEEHVLAHYGQGQTLLGHSFEDLPDGGVRCHFVWGRWPDETP